MAESIANGLRFNVRKLQAPDVDIDLTGERPVVVMLHGLIADDSSSWYFTIANPLALVADVYLYDMRGHGRTERTPTGYDIATQVDDLDALLDVWGLDRPVHLVGNSFGAAVAISAAINLPHRVASLFLVEAHFATEGWGGEMAGTFEALETDDVRVWLDAGGRKESRLAKRTEAMLLSTTMVEDLRNEPAIPHASLATIACPTYAIYGENSDILSRAEEIERFVPRSRLEIVEGASHSLLTERTQIVRERAVRWVADPERMLTPVGEAAGVGG